MKIRTVVFIADELQGGEVVLKESLDIEKYLLNPVVLLNYDFRSGPIGRVTDLMWEGNRLIASIELKEVFLDSSKKCWPAIGFLIGKERAELMSISLCTNPNIDARILTLEEQINNG